MTKLLTILSLLTISSSAMASGSFCIYTDNKVVGAKPNGSIQTILLSLSEGQTSKLVSIDESSGLLAAQLTLSNNIQTLTVLDAQGHLLARKSTSVTSGINFLMSSGDAQASIVCVPSSN